MTPKQFQKIIWDYYRNHARDFPWRRTTIPYRIAVSEIMLQQTQAQRVIPKYQNFIKQFPTWQVLAAAPLREVLLAWQGLGYNRRGKALHELANIICSDYKNKLPANPQILKTLPGIGPATAASICAFAFNQPTVFIETNIRSVFIHFFFKDQDNISDKAIQPLVVKTLDQQNPRQWYFALMDYGVMLKRTFKNPSRKSLHHTSQTPFQGSHRQIRGRILKQLTQSPVALTMEQLVNKSETNLKRLLPAIDELLKEGYLQKNRSGKITIRETIGRPYKAPQR